MAEVSQRTFLSDAKHRLSMRHPKLTWNRLAELAGIEPRALKTYRMPEGSPDYRVMPKLVRAAIEDLVAPGVAPAAVEPESQPPPTSPFESVLPAALAALVLRQARQALFQERPISGVERYPGTRLAWNGRIGTPWRWYRALGCAAARVT